MNRPGLSEINEIIALSDELEGIRTGSNSFNMHDLAIWTEKAKRLGELAQDTRNYMIQMQEYHTDVDLRMGQQEYNHDLRQAVGV